MVEIHGYCVRWSSDPPPEPGLAGLGGAPVRVVVEGPLALWVSDVAMGPATPAALREHDRVTLRALETATPLPLRFGGRFRADADVRRLLRERLGEFEVSLERVRDRVEVGFRVTLPQVAERSASPGGDGAVFDRSIRPRAPESPGLRSRGRVGVAAHGSTETAWAGPVPGEVRASGPGGDRDETDYSRPTAPASTREDDSSRPAGGRGTAYLEARRRELSLERGRVERVETLLRELDAEFVELGVPSSVTVVVRGGLVGTVAHLVHRAQVHRHREIVDHLRQTRGTLRITPSGPWAPYSFV